MYTLKLEVEDSMIDKVKMLLKQLPQDVVRIKEEKEVTESNNDFISYLVSNPIDVSNDTDFLSRTESNAR